MQLTATHLAVLVVALLLAALIAYALSRNGGVTIDAERGGTRVKMGFDARAAPPPPSPADAPAASTAPPPLPGGVQVLNHARAENSTIQVHVGDRYAPPPSPAPPSAGPGEAGR